MNWSRILAVLSALNALVTLLAGVLGGLRPQYAVILLGISAAISAFTERVHGGKSKVDDAV